MLEPTHVRFHAFEPTPPPQLVTKVTIHIVGCGQASPRSNPQFSRTTKGESDHTTTELLSRN